MKYYKKLLKLPIWVFAICLISSLLVFYANLAPLIFPPESFAQQPTPVLSGKFDDASIPDVLQASTSTPYQNVNSDVYISGNIVNVTNGSLGVGVGTVAPPYKLTVAGQGHFSRDNLGECCSSGNFTLSLAENTAGTGKRATIQFHNGNEAEGYLKLEPGSWGREITAGSYQTDMDLHATGYLVGDQGTITPWVIDINDGNYYLDPNNTSVVNRILTAGRANDWGAVGEIQGNFLVANSSLYSYGGICSGTPNGDCNGWGQITAQDRLYINGATNGWGNSVINGRVWSANSNIHLSPPGGNAVYIDSNFREAGGAGGTVSLCLNNDCITGWDKVGPNAAVILNKYLSISRSSGFGVNRGDYILYKGKNTFNYKFSGWNPGTMTTRVVLCFNESYTHTGGWNIVYTCNFPVKTWQIPGGGGAGGAGTYYDDSTKSGPITINGNYPAVGQPALINFILDPTGGSSGDQGSMNLVLY